MEILKAVGDTGYHSHFKLDLETCAHQGPVFIVAGLAQTTDLSPRYRELRAFVNIEIVDILNAVSI
jgi:hypothetical protein